VKKAENHKNQRILIETAKTEKKTSCEQKMKKESVQEIFLKFRTLIATIEKESPLLVNSGVRMTFTSKIMSLQIMQRYTTKKHESYLRHTKKTK